MNCGCWCEIIKYDSVLNVTVKFDSGYITECQYCQFKIRKSVKDKSQPTVLGIGVVGDEDISDSRGNKCVSYKKWCSMMFRCYGKHKNRERSYLGCSVCQEWWHYSNFKKWFDQNYYESEGEVMCLDKDILIKGNKVYSPSTCVFVPERINMLFIGSSSNRGKLPIGVALSKDMKYRVHIHKYKIGQCYLGKFDNLTEAFHQYKTAKEQYIKEVADDYKHIIPNNVYESMYKYQVEITD